MQTPQKGSGQRPGEQSSQVRTGNSTPQGNRAQQNYVCGKINHMTVEQAQEAPEVVLGTFLVNSELASISILEHHIHLLQINLWKNIIYP
jgi:hypothetical protein